jgi:hypothetical protein
LKPIERATGAPELSPGVEIFTTISSAVSQSSFGTVCKLVATVGHDEAEGGDIVW